MAVGQPRGGKEIQEKEGKEIQIYLMVSVSSHHEQRKNNLKLQRQTQIDG
jgi:hypothetical protein